MCFSAPASFIAGGALSAAGGATLARAKSRKSLPLAAVPLLFGVQQLLEGVIWLAEDGTGLRSFATYGYVLFSHVLWPFFLPLAVMLVEPSWFKKTLLKAFVFVGAATSLALLAALLHGPVSSFRTARGIVYEMVLPGVPNGLAAYVFATCIACFLSSHVHLRLFGLALLGALLISLWAWLDAFYSVWCFFAAVLSFIIFVHLRSTNPKNP